jgi:hypothetical protein
MAKEERKAAIYAGSTFFTSGIFIKHNQWVADLLPVLCPNSGVRSNNFMISPTGTERFFPGSSLHLKIKTP